MKTKNLLFYLCFLLLAYSSNAQTLPTLWGVCQQGGAGAGTIFKINGTVATPVFSTICLFPSDSGNNPVGTLVHATDGNLYGVTNSGTAGFNFAQTGTIYKYNPLSGGGIEYIYDLGGQNVDLTFDGDGPVEGMIQGGDGLLYGTNNDGEIGNGTAFSIDPTDLSIPNTSYHTIHAFDDQSFDDGQAAQYGILLYANDNKIYGTTRIGNNTAQDGILYSYDPSNTNYTILVKFDDNGSFPGNQPQGNLIQSTTDHRIYGITNTGGANGDGVIYSYTIGGSYTKLYDFDGTHGGNPLNGLVQASNGKFYGMTQSGGANGLGVIYSYDPTGAGYTKLYDFDGTHGANPTGVLMQASDGNIYGMTTYGGTGFSGANTGNGVAFSYVPDAGSIIVLFNLSGFSGPNPGANPNGAFIEIAPAVSNPTISVNTPSAYCSGSGNAALTASCNTNCTGITYTWAPNTNLSATTGASVTATPTITTTYTVTGTNGGGGTATATSVVTVNATPSAPVATAGTGATNTQITANWNTVGSATGYFLDVATDNGFSSFVTGFNNLNVGNVLTKNVTGLSSGTTYYYRVRATNGTCTSTNSNTITYATTGSGASCPFTGGAVTKPFTIICSGNTTTLTVTGSTGNNYNWQISSDNTNWSDISGATTTSYTTASGDGTTNKFYRLMSKSIACYNVTSTTAEVDVSNPTIVITTSNITDNSLTLNWGPTGSGNYTISYSGPTSATLTSLTPPKTITGLTPGGSYNVTVTQTGVGCTASGTITGVTTLCAVPTGVTLSSPANGQILVSWTGVGGADYRVYYRPLFSYNTYFTKDVSNVSSVLLTKQGNNNLYASTTYEVYVSRLDCPTTGATGQPTNPANVTTLPNASCATPMIDSVRSLCPVQIEVFIHDNGVNQYSVFMQRITPTILAVNSYGVSGTYFTINTPYSGDQYLIAIEAKCGGTLSNLYVWPGSLSIKPLCSSPANLVLSNPTCHGFTASWNADQCLSNSASEYALSLRVAGTINYNSYGVSLPVGGVNPSKQIGFATPGRAYQVFVRSIYNCNGFVTYGPSSQVQTISTLSSGCRDEDEQQAEETKPSAQQYSPDNSEVFSLYPNPNNGEFAVNLSRLGNEEDAVRIEVINMIGQTVVTHLTTISGGQMSEFINLPTGTAAGTYIVRLTAGKNIYTAKVNVSK